MARTSGRGAAAAHVLWEHEVAGSNPAAPTKPRRDSPGDDDNERSMSRARGQPPATANGETPSGPRFATLREFLATEAGGAIVLLAATVAALVWANSPWRDSYAALWDTEISLSAGGFALSHDLGHWINDGLMTLFFLLVGLEIRREF